MRVGDRGSSQGLVLATIQASPCEARELPKLVRQPLVLQGARSL